MTDEKIKTPEEMAQGMVNKTIAKAIADRMVEIKKHEGAIKKLNKEIEKLKSGELVPDADSTASHIPTIINFLLDESGSMEINKEKTINSFNEYIQSLKGDNINFTFTKFNSKANVIYRERALKDVVKLNNNNYTPDGLTALYDAIGKTISLYNNVNKDYKMLFVILSDGAENSSIEYKYETIKKMIDEKQKLGWVFTFMGCDINAEQYSTMFNIPKGNTISFSNYNIGLAMQSLGRGTERYLMAGSINQNVNSNVNFFSTSDKQKLKR